MVFLSSPADLERAERNIFHKGFLFEIETQVVPNPKIVSLPLNRRLMILLLPGHACAEGKACPHGCFQS